MILFNSTVTENDNFVIRFRQRFKKYKYKQGCYFNIKITFKTHKKVENVTVSQI